MLIIWKVISFGRKYELWIIQVGVLENSNYIYKIVHKFSLVNEFSVLFAKINQSGRKTKKISWMQQEPDHSPSLLIDFFT